ncbi:hypothetical protein SETIT_5G116700v2 [Setaria italica]|uniref:Uncharacterized protein n=1 Tax=Setaria italica TaxID=4555 RepID=A0A368R3P1_SETIT|nr:uncharacterized protein LOC111257460 [Setaria italica]RCV24816.1 hypothetical protein SETIT_5G116700v2 [Setaria italica]
MPCGECRCCCSSGGEAAREPLLGASADLENGRRTETTTTTTAESHDPVKEIAFLTAKRITKFTVRGLLILLWVYLYNSMRRYAINYIGEDTWFSTFAVILIAVPVVEFLFVVEQIATIPLPRSFVLCPGCSHGENNFMLN